MQYTAGDRLKLTGISGDYSTVITDIPAQGKTMTFNFVLCKDGDNNNYPVVEIGTQVWMAENLKATKYSNETAIPLVDDITAWSNLTTPGYCWYNNDQSTYGNTYGALYNWYTVNTGKLCPGGWHVPTDAECISLENYLITNGYNYDGTTILSKIAKALASTYGWYPSNNPGAVGNTDYTSKRNATGFTALPGGSRFNDGTFLQPVKMGYFWTSTTIDDNYAWSREIDYSSASLPKFGNDKKKGHSIRCLKD
jgi:uncharacterized protein (TIGR02145 family)